MNLENNRILSIVRTDRSVQLREFDFGKTWVAESHILDVSRDPARKTDPVVYSMMAVVLNKKIPEGISISKPVPQCFEHCSPHVTPELLSSIIEVLRGMVYSDNHLQREHIATAASILQELGKL